MPQFQHLVHFGTAQVNITVLQAQGFVHINHLLLIADREGQGFGSVQHLNGCCRHFHSAGCQFGVFASRRPPPHIATHAQHGFAAQTVGKRNQFWHVVFVNHDLHQSCAIPQINKNQIRQSRAAGEPSR